MSTPIIIKCITHGEFKQQPRAHKSGQGCPKCNVSVNWIPSRNTQSFITRAKEIHGDIYDYTQTEYIKTMELLTIICPTHGPFNQLANSHLNGRGCPKCANNQLRTTEDFIAKSRDIHGMRYNYDLVEYSSTAQKVTILCNKHGAYMQKPVLHLRGRGCPQCGVDSMKSKLTKDAKLFFAECSATHNDKYDYSLSIYKSRQDNISILCPEHGTFLQKASDHLRGYGCAKCAQNQRYSTAEFITKAKSVHGQRYKYSNTIYTRSKDIIMVACDNHGPFAITAGHHLSGGGCPSCSLSTQQHQIIEFLKSITDNIKINDRTLIAPYELDIVTDKTAIEFNGNYYHSYNNLESEQRYKHKHKADLATAAKINLMQISSHDWINNQQLVKSMISHRLGKSNRVHARKCSIKILTNDESQTFFKLNHISGHRSASVNYGLFSDDLLLSAINFNYHQKTNEWEIIRYASLMGYTIVGGLSKLLSSFIKEINPSNIMTFFDRRYGEGGGYRKVGFIQIGITNPGYIYLDSNCNPAGSRIKFQKHKLDNLLPNFDPNLTEAENMFNNGYRRLWDAGHYKLRLTLNDLSLNK